MDMKAYIDEIKLEVTGGILELEIGDEVLQQVLNSSLRELQRYISSTNVVTLPYSKCIDFKEHNLKVNTITKVLRASGDGISANEQSVSDPLQLSFYQLATGNNMYNLNDFVSRYASWNTARQISNTMSTDLSYYLDSSKTKLYINTSLNKGSHVTIEYVPRYDSVEEIVSDYWVDVLMRMAKASTKVLLGRIRGRYKQSNALWVSDADTMLQEGQQELAELRQKLEANTQLIYPID